jgi:hypothetical protein
MSTIQQDLGRITHLDTSKKLTLIFIFLSLFTGSYLFGRYVLNRTKTPVYTETTPPENAPINGQLNTGKAELILAPSRSTLKVGESIPVAVRLTKQSVQAADVVLTFDPKYVSISDIKAGPNFPIMLNQKINKDTVEVSASISPTNLDKPGEGDVFTFTLTGVSATPNTKVDFNIEDTIAATDGVNVLHTIVGGSYTITR